MPRTTRARSRRPKVIASALVLGLLFAFLPTPQLEFLELPFGVRVELPETRPAAASELTAKAAVAEEPLVDDRVVAAGEEPDSFSMIGVAFDEEPAEPVLVRVRTADGSWSEWNELDHSPDDGPDPGTGEGEGLIATEPLWVDGATEYELSLAATDEEIAEVALIKERSERVVTESVSMAEASIPAPFPMRARSAWNHRGNPSLSAASSVQLAVVHHTATSNNYSSSQVPGIIRSMQAYHMDQLGWSDIGYNFVVDRFGTIWEARSGSRSRAVIGAHAAGFNTGSVGVSVIGNYVSTAPSAASTEGVARVVGWRLAAAGVRPTGSGPYTSRGSNTIPAGRTVQLPRVVGHLDVGATSCPGRLYGRLGSIRNRANEWFAASNSPVGHLDSVKVDGNRVTIAGWAAFPGSSHPVSVQTYVGSRWRVTLADRLRADVARVHPTYGNRTGFQVAHTGIPPGEHRVCVYALASGPQAENTTLGCRNVVVK